MLIGLNGAKGSGKSTVAREMVLELGERGETAKIISFADPMKRAMEAVFHGVMPEDELWKCLTDPIAKETPRDEFGGQTMRWLLQSLGTDWGRKLIHPDLWINIGMTRARRSTSNFIIFDDVRFPNEAEGLDVVVNLRRPGVGLSGEHESEMYVIGETFINDQEPHVVARHLLRHLRIIK